MGGRCEVGGVRSSYFTTCCRDLTPHTSHPAPLPLAELELLSRLRTARLLALDRTRIAREQAQVTKLAAMGFVDLHERTRDGQAERPGLTGLAAAGEVRLHIVAAQRVGRRERLLDRG